MTFSSRIEDNGFKGAVILVLFIVLSIKSCMVHAQALRPTFYKGLEAGFGVRTFTISSNIDELKNASVHQEGGSAGLVFGTEKIKFKLRGGIYYAAGNSTTSVNLLETDASTTVYPLQFVKHITCPIQPYVITGISYNTYKFFGHYMDPDGSASNYSSTREPFVGRISQTSATVGMGIEWRLVDEYNFVHLFAQVRTTVPFMSGYSNDALSQTKIGNVVMVNVGVSFGYYR